MLKTFEGVLGVCGILGGVLGGTTIFIFVLPGARCLLAMSQFHGQPFLLGEEGGGGVVEMSEQRETGIPQQQPQPASLMGRS